MPYAGAGFTLRAQGLAGDLSSAFATLNQRLNDGGVHGSRRFQFKQGDLQIGNGVRANQVQVSLDNGHLRVNGLIDASGERVGSIRLAAGNGLTLAQGAVLDAHGSVLRVDSYGKIIDSPNRATVELNAGAGQLTLARDVRIDLRHGTDAPLGGGAGQHDGRERGTLALYAPRLRADDPTHGDIAIDASQTLSILGAQRIDLFAMARDDAAPQGVDPHVSGKPYVQIDQAYLDARHAQSVQFIDSALANTALVNGKLAGLVKGYAQQFHLRPGLEVITDGDLVISGDLDLSRYRYASLNPNVHKTGAVYGSGEAGSLSLRAGGDVEVLGSINDGFAPPSETQDDGGWVLLEGRLAYGAQVVVPNGGSSCTRAPVFWPARCSTTTCRYRRACWPRALCCQCVQPFRPRSSCRLAPCSRRRSTTPTAARHWRRAPAWRPRCAWKRACNWAPARGWWSTRPSRP
ncbi:hypothetical protein NWF32_27200 [Pseudomonas qingdaonensis]|nr:hypothetical protein [Pseudomonas qingdaonensis]